MERGLVQVLPNGGERRSAQGAGQERGQVPQAEPLRRPGPRLGVPELQGRREAEGQGELRPAGAGAQGGVRQGVGEDGEGEAAADHGGAGGDRVRQEGIRRRQADEVGSSKRKGVWVVGLWVGIRFQNPTDTVAR